MPAIRSRFSTDAKSQVIEFTQSLNNDRELFLADVAASEVHTIMLAGCGIIPQDDAALILAALAGAREKFISGKFEFDENLEDVHINIESYMISNYGVRCGAVHTARSRNDQVVTDMRCVVRERINGTIENLIKFIEILLEIAKQHKDTLMPGYTHLQRAQPTVFGHWLTAYAFALSRDIERLESAYKRVNLCPLGAAAFGGTSFNIDRKLTADLLGFDGIIENSLDAVAARDFSAEVISDLAVLMSTLGRLSEEIIIFNSSEFNFLNISDEYATGSSIMPQKKNPDIAELSRGRTGAVYGNLISILTMLKGIPYTYNRDMQEDKKCVFESFNTVNSVLCVFCGMVGSMKVNRKVMRKRIDTGIAATEIANLITIRGMPFRSAYSIVGDMVKNGLLDEIDTAEELKIAPGALERIKFKIKESGIEVTDDDIISAIDPAKCVSSRKSTGSTNPAEVLRMADMCGKRLENFRENLRKRRERIDTAFKEKDRMIKEITG